MTYGTPFASQTRAIPTETMSTASALKVSHNYFRFALETINESPETSLPSLILGGVGVPACGRSSLLASAKAGGRPSRASSPVIIYDIICGSTEPSPASV
jgi:hypothetical protein